MKSKINRRLSVGNSPVEPKQKNMQKSVSNHFAKEERNQNVTTNHYKKVNKSLLQGTEFRRNSDLNHVRKQKRKANFVRSHCETKNKPIFI
jgi:hypothetical protein